MHIIIIFFVSNLHENNRKRLSLLFGWRRRMMMIWLKSSLHLHETCEITDKQCIQWEKWSERVSEKIHFISMYDPVRVWCCCCVFYTFIIQRISSWQFLSTFFFSSPLCVFLFLLLCVCCLGAATKMMKKKKKCSMPLHIEVYLAQRVVQHPISFDNDEETMAAPVAASIQRPLLPQPKQQIHMSLCQPWHGYIAATAQGPQLFISDALCRTTKRKELWWFPSSSFFFIRPVARFECCFDKRCKHVTMLDKNLIKWKRDFMVFI